MKKWIEDHLISNGKLISRRLNENWFISNGYEKELNLLKNTHLKLTNACKIELGLQQKCKCCDNLVFRPREYCSLTCSNKSKDRIEKIKHSWDGDVSTKRKQTMKERYGYESNFHNHKVQNKVKETLSSYGVCNVSQLDYVKKKKKNTVDNWTKEYKEKVYSKIGKWEQDHYSKELKEELSNKLTNITSINDQVFESVKSLSTVYRLVNKHRPELISSGISSGHKDILTVLDSLGIEYIVNDRKRIAPLELDILIPSLNIAFEYNGTYWHSDQKVSRDYHQLKSLKCFEIGIKLIHLYEFDGLEKNKKIVESFVKPKTSISSSNCIVKKLKESECKEFIEKNDRFGYSNSSIFFGLYYEAKLVQVITIFAKTQSEYELTRFCSCENYVVIDGFEKLLSVFINTYTPSSIVAYSNLDNGFTTIYEKFGFRRIGVTEPSYVSVNESDSQQLKEDYLKVYNSGNEFFEWTTQ